MLRLCLLIILLSLTACKKSAVSGEPEAKLFFTHEAFKEAFDKNGALYSDAPLILRCRHQAGSSDALAQQDLSGGDRKA